LARNQTDQCRPSSLAAGSVRHNRRGRRDAEALLGEHRDGTWQMAGGTHEENRGRSEQPFGPCRVLIGVSGFCIDHCGGLGNAEANRPSFHFDRFLRVRAEDPAVPLLSAPTWGHSPAGRGPRERGSISGIGRWLGGWSKRAFLVDACPQDHDCIKAIGRRQLRGVVPGFERTDQRGGDQRTG